MYQDEQLWSDLRMLSFERRFSFQTKLFELEVRELAKDVERRRKSCEGVSNNSVEEVAAVLTEGHDQRH